MRELESQDVATLSTLARRFGLIDTAAIVAWADSIIADTDETPYWAIELALARPDNVDALLDQTPGDRSDDLAHIAFLALLWHHWGNGHVSINEVHVIGRKMHFEGLFPGYPDEIDWGIVLDCEFDEYVEGFRTEKDMRDSITEKLSHYEQYKDLIPTWILRHVMFDSSKKSMLKLYRNAHEAAHDILTHEWDPIGVGDEPMAQDEYNAYIGGVLSMLRSGKNDKAIAKHLLQIETEDMGLNYVKGAEERNLRVVRRLRVMIKPFFIE